ncbi:MAG TPA: SRPBCC domain-containing protein [Pseudonocardia sp.]
MTSPDPLIATIRIAAPPTAVFPYLIEAPLLARWIGDATGSTPEPGGAFALAIGDSTSVRGQFLTVDPPKRVVFTWGVPGRDVLPAGSTTVEIVLTPDGPDTIVELTHHGLPRSEVASHQAGWTGLLDVLARVAAR